MINIEPIISPWVFYWIDMLDKVRFCFVIILISSALSSGLCVCSWGIEHNFEKDSTYRTPSIVSLVALFISSIGALVAPSTDTAYKMLVASYVTPDNINSTVQFTQEAFKTLMDGIVETAQRLQGL